MDTQLKFQNPILKGKTTNEAQTNTNTSFSPSLSHNIKQQSNPASPKSNVIQTTTTDLNSQTTTTTANTTPAATTPQANQKSATSPLSSCSNSPSSVRINQNYDPNNVTKQSATDEPTNNDVTNSHADIGECDLDNSEDADSKPLLNATETTQIVTKRTNNRCEKTDQQSATKADSDNESDTLITNSHN